MHVCLFACLPTSLSSLCDGTSHCLIAVSKSLGARTCMQVPWMCFAFSWPTQASLPLLVRLTNLSTSLFCCFWIIFPNSPNEFSSGILSAPHTATGSLGSPYLSDFLYIGGFSLFISLFYLSLDSVLLWWEESGWVLGTRFWSVK